MREAEKGERGSEREEGRRERRERQKEEEEEEEEEETYINVHDMAAAFPIRRSCRPRIPSLLYLPTQRFPLLLSHLSCADAPPQGHSVIQSEILRIP